LLADTLKEEDFIMKHQTLCVWLAGIVLLGFSTALLGQEELVVVLKDGRRQSFRMADVARIEFVAGSKTSMSPAVDFLKPDKVISHAQWATFERVKTPMTLHGRSASLFVLQHPGAAPTEAIYYLNGRASRFTASVGIDQSMAPDNKIGAGATVEYLIYTDGRLAWRSGLVTLQTPVKNVDVDLSGVNELRLVVTNGGDNTDWDWAVWADPTIR
jgi:hypothetical protein